MILPMSPGNKSFFRLTFHPCATHSHTSDTVLDLGVSINRGTRQPSQVHIIINRATNQLWEYIIHGPISRQVAIAKTPVSWAEVKTKDPVRLQFEDGTLHRILHRCSSMFKQPHGRPVSVSCPGCLTTENVLLQTLASIIRQSNPAGPSHQLL